MNMHKLPKGFNLIVVGDILSRQCGYFIEPVLIYDQVRYIVLQYERTF